MTLKHNNHQYPLSSSQREVWFDQILHPDVPLYNIGGYLQISGPIDPALFEKSLKQVIQDNDALRIRLVEGESLPMQTFAENIHFKLDYYDFAAKEKAHQAALAWMKQEFAKPFQLYDKLLFQFALLKISEKGYYFFKKYHHLIVDGWAISLIGQRVAMAYNALATGQSACKKKPYSYQNFLQNDQAYLKTDKFAQAKHYWLSKYCEVPEPLLKHHYAAQLMDNTIPSQLSILTLKRAFYNQLAKLASQNKVSTFHVILGALYCYFAKTTGQKNIVIGLPILNRGTAAFKQTVGLFTNIIPARFHFSLDLSFVELIQAISIELRRDYRYQRFPISEINRELHLTQRRSLFDLVLSYEKHDYDTHFNDSPAEAVSLLHGFDQNALEIYIREFHRDLDVRVHFEYNLGFFDAEEIELIKARFEFLLGEIIRQPDQLVRKLPIIPEASRQKILECSGNQVHPTNPFIEFPKCEQSIGARFEQQVKQYPNRLAVKTKHYTWTYQELNDKANQVAHALLEQCQADDNQIALLFEHDAPMLAGIMGVLKTGKVYVPLATDFPGERLESLVQDSQASVILTNTHNQNMAQTLSHNSLRLLNIDQLKTAKTEIDLTVSPDTIAYLLYTSGSTGQPKGVIQNHRNVLHFIRAYTNNLHITADDKLTLLSYYSFDAAVVDIFAALLNGATLYLVNLKEESFTALSEWLIQQQITIYHSTPTVYRHWLNSLTEKETFEKIRLVVLGGEPVYQSHVDGYNKHFSSECLFVNGLGSTESTFSLQYFINQQTQITRHEVPVGYPLEETEIVLLDDTGTETDIYGEIAIRSPYLALGYWQQPELTKAVFLPDPEEENRRIYRSGDMGRLLPNGSLEFVGRKDFQVKLRGFRIELLEIEAVLSQHEAIKEAVVIVYEADDNKRLLAYLTTDSVTNDLVLVIKDWLKARLPDYMIPSQFIVLDKLPLTLNGKIDRKALPAPSTEISIGAKPITPTEELLASLWAAILKRETVNRSDNFFELGGHSLLATQLVARIRDAFQVELPVRTVFESKQLSQLALAIVVASGGVCLPPIEKQAASSNKVLSFAQQRLWFLNQFEDNKSATYNMPAALRLKGHLEVTALQQSLHYLLQRHESLRSTFPSMNGQAQVRILDLEDFEILAIHDLTKLSGQSQAFEVQNRAHLHATAPFDLANGPLFKADLLLLSQQQSVLLLNMHHIISDGWSRGIFIRDWQHAYTAFAQGEQPSLPPLAIQYSDYAWWQRNWLQGSVLQQQVDYWRSQLAKAPDKLELPTDKPRPAIQQHQGSHITLHISRDLTEQLKQLSQVNHLTLFMTLLGAFNILLYRYSGQDDICIGTPVANRYHSQLEPVIGLFLSTVVLLTHIPVHTTFPQFLAQIRQTVLEAFAHLDVPFELLVEQLRPQRHLSHHPLFQVMFNLINTPDRIKLELPGIHIEHLQTSSTIAKFDLNLALTENGEGLTGRFEYDTALFTEETVRFLGECYLTLLQEIVAKPNVSLSQLSLLSEAWRNRVAKLQHPTPTNSFEPFPDEIQSIPERFVWQVQRYPDRIAVKTKHYTWTYQELNDKANQVAHALLEQCQANDNQIALLFEHDAPMLAGIMGVLKAGKAYVPLATDFPRERLEYLVQDSQASVILTNTRNQNLAQTLSHNPLCLLNIDQLKTAQNEIDLTVSPDTIAYLLYTSGSMGQPKGVIQNHRNVLHFIRTYTNQLHISADDKLTLLSYYSFDAALVDIFAALLNGATLYPVNLKEESITALSVWLIQQQITIYHSTPTVYRHWLDSLTETETFDKIRLVVLGGEPVYQRDVKQYQKHFSSECLFVNGLGSTESTFSLQYIIAQQTPSIRHEVPVGYPLSETNILLLNEASVDNEIYGEIAIRSPYLALGYWQQPELTQTVFLPDSENESGRIYRSGDMGRLLPNGSLEFVGRKDFQVKLRGFRIELLEIEAVLSQHEAIKEAVVIVYEADDNKRLLAYITTDSSENDLVLAIKDWLKARLPDYMIPSQFIVLDKLPLTPNGKIDRRALPSPEMETTSGGTQPITPTEELLASLWTSILKRETVNRSDNFFELGGHSLLATQLVARIRDAFQVELPVRTVFESKQLSQLALAIVVASGGVCLPPIEKQAASSNKVLSFAQQRLWFLNQFEDNKSATYNMPAALRLEGHLEVTALQQSLHWLLQRHESLRSTFPSPNGQAQVQIMDLEDLEILATHNLRHLTPEQQNEEVQNRSHLHAITPFDLANGPLFKADLLLLSQQQSVLLLNMHHIISDGWSIGVFIRDWQHAYTAFAQGEQPSLPPLSIEYSDYAAWQREWLQGSVLQQQVDYWSGQLAGAPSLLELPSDKPRPPERSYQGAHYLQRLSPTLRQALKSLSREQTASLFMTLLTTFDILLSRYCLQDDVCVGSPIAGRTHRQTEELIGFFVNTLVLRCQIQPQLSFIELLQKNRKICLEAYAHQDIPFEMLVEQLQPTRSLSHSPLFQVMLVLQNHDTIELTLPGLEMMALEMMALEQDYPLAKFDLTLNVKEQNGELHCLWAYTTDLFYADTISRMADHFKVLLTAIVENPAQAISQLPMLTDQEVQQLLAWNHTTTNYPQDKTIVDLFEQQVEKTPSNIAVIFEEQHLNYQQLNHKANQVAHHLVTRLNQAGIRENNPLIAIAVERSLDMVIGLLGILKAGGAYVPIDQNYPAARIQYMLEDSKAPLLVTQSHLKTHLSLDTLEHDCVLVFLDETELVSQPTSKPACGHQTDDLVYVIYTSGSTGKPKGVMVDHKALCNYVFYMQRHFVHQGHFAWLSTIAADLGNTTIFGALCSGSALCVIDQQCALDSNCFYNIIKQYKIDYLKITPTHLMGLQTQETPVIPARLLIVGGEASSVEWINTLREQYPHCHILNHYGPTEATVGVTTYLVDEDANSRNTMLPIGKPISNARIYILAKTGQPQPPNIPGELCIAGQGLARGYLNRPELTAEKFIEVELFGKTERIYKTGDLARWLPDGNLEYLGRIDSQVKLRGFRIELLEIEAVLSQHEAVREAVVIVYEADDNKQLVAYLTTNSSENDFVAAIKDWLKVHLPDYMIPSQFILLEKLPLTANGKIDRKALPAADANTLTENTLPRNAIELQMLGIWETVLNVHPLGIHDNFFDLGGHSLLAVKLMSYIQQQCGVRLPVSALFQSPTVATLSQLLRQDFTPLSNLVPIQTKGFVPAVYCLPGAVGSVMYLYPLASSLGEQQPFYALQTPGLDGSPTPETVEALAGYHLQALRLQQATGPYQLIGHSSGGKVAFEMAWQLEQQGETIAFLGILDTKAPDANQPNPKADYTELDWLSNVVVIFEELTGIDLNRSLKDLQSLPDLKTAYTQVMQAFVERQILFAPGAPVDELKALVNTYRITIQEHAKYKIPGKLCCPIHLFRAEEKTSNAENMALEETREAWGWAECTHSKAAELMVPGTHITMMTLPHVKILADKLSQYLASS